MSEHTPLTEAAGPFANTDRELFREGGGDGNGQSYYEPSIHVTAQGHIGMNVGGRVYTLPIREWHALAARTPTATTDTGLRERVEALAEQWGTFPCGGTEALRQLRAALAATAAPTTDTGARDE